MPVDKAVVKWVLGRAISARKLQFLISYQLPPPSYPQRNAGMESVFTENDSFLTEI
jgi:hypothetical protein